MHDKNVLVNFKGIFKVTGGCVENNRSLVVELLRVNILYYLGFTLRGEEVRINSCVTCAGNINKVVSSDHPQTVFDQDLGLQSFG